MTSVADAGAGAEAGAGARARALGQLLAPGTPAGRPAAGVTVVWRVELAKLVHLQRVRLALAVCLLGPFGAALALSAQSSLPTDTPFGQWLHESGLALPPVVLAFAGQWALPLLASLVAGDIFAAEDQFGTWKLVLTRGQSRGALFTGKVLAALTFSTVALAGLAVSSLAAGLLVGREPAVGLGGQLVPAGHAAVLALASWACDLPPLVGFTLLATLLSVTSRSSVLGTGGPVLAGLLMQLLALLTLPLGLHDALLTTPFAAWHGLWTEPSYLGPLLRGLLTSTVWSVLCLGAAWAVFRSRRFPAA